MDYDPKWVEKRIRDTAKILNKESVKLSVSGALYIKQIPYSKFPLYNE